MVGCNSLKWFRRFEGVRYVLLYKHKKVVAYGLVEMGNSNAHDVTVDSVLKIVLSQNYLVKQSWGKIRTFTNFCV